MKTYLHKLFLIALAVTSIVTARAGDQAVAVTIQNFPRAETDLYFGRFVKEKGLGRLGGSGEVTPIARWVQSSKTSNASRATCSC